MVRAYDDNGNVVDLVEWEKQIRTNAIDEFTKGIDLDKPMHFTKEQVAWIKKYVILKRQETIDEALQIFHNVYTQNLYCMEDECESKGMDCDGCLYITFQKHLKLLKGGGE